MAKRDFKMPALKVLPIGGLNEIGKNMTLLECNDQILIIDCGMSFPDDEMFGIDVVIPDFSYLIENRDKIVGMIITHGHEDHIGGIPYLLRDISVPIYGTKFTLGLIKFKLQEQNLYGDLNEIEPDKKFKLGCFDIEAISITHSICDAVCFAIDTPQGMIFHTGDFKVDYTPIGGDPINLQKLAQIGAKGVKLLMCDSTNAVRTGFTRSESVVGETIEEIFRQAKGRIIIATFSSNVHRVQQIIEAAIKCGRKVAISGRSMENVVSLALDLDYLHIPAGTLVDLSMIRDIPDDKLVIITTGSQGEPMSALSRIASGEHRNIKLKPNDMVILSSTPIPGNENSVSSVVNKLCEKGANVIYSEIADIHVSGHACQEELKLIHSLIKPEYFMPVHGEYRHLIQHKEIAKSLGLNKDNIFILKNGDCLTINQNSVVEYKNVAPADSILVDGLGVGDIGNIVLRDRKMLATSGLIIVCAVINPVTNELISGPDIISRGFVYVRENEELIEAAKNVCKDVIYKCLDNGNSDWQTMKSKIKSELGDFIYEATKRTPIILPIFMEV